MTVQDPFEDAKPASLFPSMEQLAGRLVMVKPLDITKDIPSTKYKDSKGRPVLSDRIDADVTVVDGPVEGFDTTEFKSMWISGSYQVTQLTGPLTRGTQLLGRVNLKDPSRAKGQGNPWGFNSPTDADKQIARDYLAGRTIGAAEAPKQDTPKNPFG